MESISNEALSQASISDLVDRLNTDLLQGRFSIAIETLIANLELTVGESPLTELADALLEKGYPGEEFINNRKRRTGRSEERLSDRSYRLYNINIIDMKRSGGGEKGTELSFDSNTLNTVDYDTQDGLQNYDTSDAVFIDLAPKGNGRYIARISSSLWQELQEASNDAKSRTSVVSTIKKGKKEIIKTLENKKTLSPNQISEYITSINNNIQQCDIGSAIETVIEVDSIRNIGDEIRSIGQNLLEKSIAGDEFREFFERVKSEGSRERERRTIEEYINKYNTLINLNLEDKRIAEQDIVVDKSEYEVLKYKKDKEDSSSYIKDVNLQDKYIFSYQLKDARLIEVIDKDKITQLRTIVEQKNVEQKNTIKEFDDKQIKALTKEISTLLPSNKKLDNLVSLRESLLNSKNQGPVTIDQLIKIITDATNLNALETGTIKEKLINSFERKGVNLDDIFENQEEVISSPDNILLNIIATFDQSQQELLKTLITMDSASFLVFIKTQLIEKLTNDQKLLNQCDTILQSRIGGNNSILTYLKTRYNTYDLTVRNEIVNTLFTLMINSQEANTIIQESLKQHLDQDRTLAHRRRSNRLKQMSEMMHIINQNPTLSQQFKSLKLPSSIFKTNTETSMTGNIHHRQLTAFMSMISRDEGLRQLFYKEGMRIAKQNSDTLREKLEQGEITSIQNIRVGLGVNGGIMAETENRLLPESVDNTIYLGEEDYFGGSFNLGGYLNSGFQTNSRNRIANNTSPMLPSYAGSINHPGMFSILGEADMHSGVYSNDDDWGFEIFSKFYFNANYLFGAQVIYEKLNESGDAYLIKLLNKNTNTVISIEANDIVYMSGLGNQKRGFEKIDNITTNFLQQERNEPGKMKAIEDSYQRAIRNPKYKKEKTLSILNDNRYYQFPQYLTGLQVLELCKNPNIDMLDILSGATVAIIGDGDTANVVQENLLTKRSTTPRQTIQAPTIVLIGKNKTKQGSKQGRLRYGQLGNFYENENYQSNVNVYSVEGRSIKINDYSSSECSLLISGDLNSISEITRDTLDISERSLGLRLNTIDLIIDCSGLDIKQGIENTILTSVDEVVTDESKFSQKFKQILSEKKLGSSIIFDSGEELIIKDIYGNLEYSNLYLECDIISNDQTYQKVTISIDSDDFAQFDSYEDINDTYVFEELLYDSYINGPRVKTITTYFNYDDFGKTGLVRATDDKQNEVIDMVFGDQDTNNTYIYRKLGDTIGHTTLQGPCANIPLNEGEKVLFDQIGIPQNLAARFRYHWRIYSQVIEDYASKRITSINTSHNNMLVNTDNPIEITITDDQEQYIKQYDFDKVDIILNSHTNKGLELFMKENILGMLCQSISGIKILGKTESYNKPEFKIICRTDKYINYQGGSMSYARFEDLSQEEKKEIKKTGKVAYQFTLRGDNQLTNTIIRNLNISLDDNMVKYLISYCKIHSQKSKENRATIAIKIPLQITKDDLLKVDYSSTPNIIES